MLIDPSHSILSEIMEKEKENNNQDDNFEDIKFINHLLDPNHKN